MLRVEVDPCFPGSALVDATTLSCPLILSSARMRPAITPLDRRPCKCYYAASFMSGITSIALMGLFAWSGATAAGTSTWTPQIPVLSTNSQETQSISVKITGYNAVPEQTDSNPDITASGAFSNPDLIAARSRDLAEELPFGTVITFESTDTSNSCGFDAVEHLIGYRVIADTMHERMHDKVDVMFDSSDMVQVGVNGESRRATNPAVALGVCDVSIRVVGKISIKDMPSTQKELALLMSQTFALR